MKIENLKRRIEKLGGTATITTEGKVNPTFGTWESIELNGELNGYDIHMFGETSSYFTVRRISKRGYFDPGADYNSGDYSFCHRLNDLQYYCHTSQVAA